MQHKSAYANSGVSHDSITTTPRRLARTRVGLVSVFGVEKSDVSGRIARMNLALHGLEGDIRHGGVGRFPSRQRERDKTQLAEYAQAVERAKGGLYFPLRSGWRT